MRNKVAGTEESMGWQGSEGDEVYVCKAAQNGFSGSSIIVLLGFFSESEVRSSSASASDSLLSSLVDSNRFPCGFVPLERDEIPIWVDFHETLTCRSVSSWLRRSSASKASSCCRLARQTLGYCNASSMSISWQMLLVRLHTGLWPTYLQGEPLRPFPAVGLWACP